MPSTITAEKTALRAAALATLEGLSSQDRQDSDRALFRRFLALPQVGQASTLLLYYGMGVEPDTKTLFSSLWKAGKALCLPRCLPGNQMEARLVQRTESLIRHPYGMLEPGEDCPRLETAQIDLALVPGLAFDRAGGRLGRGGGYYDRWLAGFSGVTVALCRQAVFFNALPRLPHDLGVDLVVTETGLYGPSHSVPLESGA